MSLADLQGTFVLDPTHTTLSFVTRHAMVTKVRGSFEKFEGQAIVDGSSPETSSLSVNIDVASVTTRNADRDAHLRSADFFDADEHPTLDFVSTGVRYDGGDFLVDGDLTIRGVTRPATFELEFGGFGVDPWGSYKAGATAKTVIDREDFGLTWNAALETGGVLVGKDVTITLDLQGSLQA